MPEYVAEHSLDDPRPLAVLISNSQGAYNGDDASVLYPALLQTRMHEVRLENWSTDGIRSDRKLELVIWRKALASRGAKLIVIVLGATSIDPPQLATIDYGNTDIDLLLGEPSLWRTLCGGLTFAQIDRDQFAARLLRAHVPLVRARTAFRDKLAVMVPPECTAHPPLFGRHLDFLIRGPKSAVHRARPGQAARRHVRNRTPTRGR